MSHQMIFFLVFTNKTFVMSTVCNNRPFRISLSKNVTLENTKLFTERYKNYKKMFETSQSYYSPVRPKLKYVRIYYDTSTFDQITKDRAAKFVDMLSAIGGTMGLLTGFSIISGVEILYFMVKIIYKCLRNKRFKI